MEIAVICVLKSGGDYDATYVEKMRNMVLRNATVPFKFYCLTDIEVECDKIPLKDNLKGWWSKIEIFRPDLVKEKRIIYFDLDTVIVGNIDEYLLEDADFVALGALSKNKKRNSFGSGFMSWKNNYQFCFLYDDFSIYLAGKFRGDQDYIHAKLLSEDKDFTTWQKKHEGVYSYKWDCINSLPSKAKIVCFHGKPRPTDVNVNWVNKNWK